MADDFSREIERYLEELGEVNIKRLDELMNHFNNWTIASAVLPIVITFISAYSYILTQQVVTFVMSLVDVVPPYFLSKTKTRIDFYNERLKLKFAFIGLKGRINRLAIIGQLKEPALTDITNEMNDLKKTLEQTLKIAPP